MASVISPLVTTYATRTPYITVAEFLATPTALEVEDLIPGAEEEAQTQALTDAISRASSWVDRICHQILACTVDIQPGRYRIDRRGFVRVPLKYNPVLEVSAVSVGLRASQMVALTDLSDVELYEYSVEVPVLPAQLPSGYGGYNVGDKLITNITYVNGWVNTLVSGSTGSGSSTLPVTSTLGIYPGTSFTVYDGINTEPLVASSSYVPGTSPIALAGVTQFAHNQGVSVSNLPPGAKAATVLLAATLIQTRGNDALVLDTTDTPKKVEGETVANATDIDIAIELLDELIRVK